MKMSFANGQNSMLCCLLSLFYFCFSEQVAGGKDLKWFMSTELVVIPEFMVIPVLWFHKNWKSTDKDIYCCCSVPLLCPTICDPTDCHTPGFPVFHHFLELA